MKKSDVAPTRTFALVVGIERYALDSGPGIDLDGPAHDARAFAEWLVQKGLPQENIALLLSPLDHNRHLFEGWSGPWKWRATLKEIDDAVHDWLQPKVGDLLWVFWGGHGVITAKQERRLFYADTTSRNWYNLNWESLRIHLASNNLTSFQQQIYLIDTCANYKREISQEQLGEGHGFPSGLPVRGREQFSFFATREGERAKNLTQEHSGFFSKYLLEELAGSPTAPWPPDMEEIAERLKERFATLKGESGVNQTPISVDHRDWEGSIHKLVHIAGQAESSDRPQSYLPISRFRSSIFQFRPEQFKHLEQMLFTSRTAGAPLCIGLVGMGGLGKTRLAVEIASQYEERFPAGVFFMVATGIDLQQWQSDFAQLAEKTDFLPSDDERSRSPQKKEAKEAKAARYICRYLTSQPNALLILDNVEKPDLVMEAISDIAGKEVKCAIIYTSRYPFNPGNPYIIPYPLSELSEDAALGIFLERRKDLLSKALSSNKDAEIDAARNICQYVEHLPLALILLRDLLGHPPLTVEHLFRELQRRGSLEVTRKYGEDKAPLFSTFLLSWEKIVNKDAQRVFKLASYFPEASSIPLNLLGLATGLDKGGTTILEPLGAVCIQLQEWSLIEDDSEGQIRLHPVIREFGQQLVKEDGDTGKALLEEAGKRLRNGLGEQIYPLTEFLLMQREIYPDSMSRVEYNLEEVIKALIYLDDTVFLSSTVKAKVSSMHVIEILRDARANIAFAGHSSNYRRHDMKFYEAIYRCRKLLHQAIEELKI